jgi:sugar fermentation stimulation protein A
MLKPILKLPHDTEAIFQERPNRFLGLVNFPETQESEQVHIHDPGRLEELLYTNNRVLVKRAKNPKRKTKWDTLAALIREDGVEVFVEVKGCTLAIDGIALFPDAPTKRGTRHVQTLMDLRSEGFDIALIILVFRHDSKCFAPNKRTDPVFAETLSTAIQNFGLKVYPILLEYDGKNIYYNKSIPLCPNI